MIPSKFSSFSSHHTPNQPICRYYQNLKAQLHQHEDQKNKSDKSTTSLRLVELAIKIERIKILANPGRSCGNFLFIFKSFFEK